MRNESLYPHSRYNSRLKLNDDMAVSWDTCFASELLSFLKS
jgi:hypothetical protein